MRVLRPDIYARFNFMRTFLLALTLAAAAVAADLPVAQPADVAARLRTAKGAVPSILYVGPNVLFRSKHIPGSVYAGMAAHPEGLASLRKVAAGLPRNREVLVYCGCCPWDKCPNVRPAVEELKRMGFTRVKAIYMENGFAKDWVDRGYPFDQGQNSSR